MKEFRKNKLTKNQYVHREEMSKTLCKTLGKCRLLSIKKNCILRLVELSPLKPKSTLHTTQKMNFSIKYFFSKCDQIRRNLRIWSHFLKKSLMENFIFSACHQKRILHHWQISGNTSIT